MKRPFLRFLQATLDELPDWAVKLIAYSLVIALILACMKSFILN